MASLVIGITGTIGTGKSTVAKMLKSLGKKDVLVLDADKIAKQFLKKGSDSSKLISSMFPESLKKDSSIDAKKLSDIVFQNKFRLSALNGLMHPFIIRAIKQKLEKIKEKIVILDVPLLVEANMLDIVNKLIIVDTNFSVVKNRSKFSKKELEKRLANQMPFSKKKTIAQDKLGKENVFIIVNSSDLNKTKEQVKHIWNSIRFN